MRLLNKEKSDQDKTLAEAVGFWWGFVLPWIIGLLLLSPFVIIVSVT